jgi:nucleotide-binding universal stress UspA family protein
VDNILVAIDDCENTSIATPIMEKTLELARNTTGKVWVVHVVPDTNRPIPFNIDRTVLRQEVAAELSNERAHLQQLAHCLRKRDIDAKALLLEGETVRTLLREVLRLDIDLIILGCHKHNPLYGALMRLTEDSVLSKCPCPIMFVPDSAGDQANSVKSLSFIAPK